MGNRINMTGLKYNRLTAIEFVGHNKYGQALWKFKCDCGSETILPGKSVRAGNTKSCGCLNVESSTKRITEKNTTHGESNTRLFRIWSGMKTRCENPKASNYADYGGRGIAVCSEWQNYAEFSNWARRNGYADNLSIDRINNSEGYCPNNCRWTNSKTQARNRRSGKRITFNGETHSIVEWAEKIGISGDALGKRLKSPNFTFEEAMTAPRKRTMAEYARRNL